MGEAPSNRTELPPLHGPDHVLPLVNARAEGSFQLHTLIR